MAHPVFDRRRQCAGTCTRTRRTGPGGRPAAAAGSVGGTNQTATVPNDIRVRYPILSAAIMPTEDIVMTCARALDEQNDVSLVREAAAYLEEIEQYK